MGAGSHGVSPGNYVGRRVLSSQGAAPAALLGAHVRRAGAVLLLLEALAWRFSPLPVSNVRALNLPQRLSLTQRNFTLFLSSF
jgi:hypothetical protein